MQSAGRKQRVLGVRFAMVLAVGLSGVGSGLALVSSAAAQQVVNPCTKSDTTQSCAPVTATYPLPVTVSGGSGGGASIGANGASAPTSSDQLGWVDGSGNLQPAGTTTPLPTNTVQVGGTTVVANQQGSGVITSSTVRTVEATDSTLITDLNAISGFQAGTTQACTVLIPISQTTSTDLHSFTNTGRICAIHLQSAGAQNVSLVDGTGTVCATNIAALDGATTAANGVALGVGGGWVEASAFPIFAMTGSARHLCLLQDGAFRLSGQIVAADK